MGRMDYLRAAQPRIVALFLVTVLAAMLLAGGADAWLVIAVLAATALTVAGAAILNNVIERDADARMERTRRRPTASGRLRPGRARAAGLAAVAAGVLALWATAGGLAAVFALLGAAYYVLVYTLLLKPRTALSSVPGALAGVFPALIGWAATGAPWSADILFLCAVVFVWSPPHFWALALAREDDYRASGIPTPAVRYGEPATRRLIVAFFAILTGIVTAAAVTGLYGLPYVSIALATTLVLWFFVARLQAARNSVAAWALFKVSGPCLAAIVAAAVVDRLL
jgi:protoheme IX farnesyltransferase